MRPWQPDIVGVDFEEAAPEIPMLHVRVSEDTLALLRRLVATGFFGRTIDRAANILLRERLRELISSHVLDVRWETIPFYPLPPPVPPMPMPPMQPPRTRPKRKHAPRRTRTSSR